jgi:hypothetical protein
MFVNGLILNKSLIKATIYLISLKIELYICTVKNLAFLIIIVLFLKPVFPVIDYAVNYDYISKVLCINKEKPAMHCNGKCHLMKELAKASEIEKPISSDKKQNINVLNDLFVEEWETFHLAIMDLQDKSLLNSKYSNFYSHLESYSIFHPPINIS